jgi:N-acetylglucosamine-6-sulfatase
MGATFARAGAHPNIVLILTDDQRCDQLSHMPFVQEHLIDRGRRLKRYFVANPLCCPSRTTTLTGLYSHSTGIYLNGDGPAGGFDDFRDRSTIATWLQDAGYRTGLFGKYLNHYDRGGYVPPGWNTWRGLVGVNSSYYDYDLSRNGTMQHFSSASDDYATDVYGRMASNFVRTTPADKPLFLYFAPPAPHGPTTPPPRYENALSNVRMPRYPDYQRERRVRQTHVAPKVEPAVVGTRRRDAGTMGAHRPDPNGGGRCRGQDHEGARSDRRLHNTLIVFTSDNGLSYGEHRLMGKLTPYEDSVRVPMVVRWDGRVPPGTVSMRLAANVDLAATSATAAHAAHPTLEGVSLLPLLRHDMLVHRALLVEHQHGRYRQDPPTYCQIRSESWTLIRYASGSTELYNVRADPYELRNAASSPALATKRHHLMARLRVLCSPRPPGMPRF